ncbi:RNA polymerase sigma factor [Chitinophagaceae bacterium 26-R-25]|nr:RNA polymerase sigma factor [Chitinophagaceae bacterium 26-R-25]
MESRSETEQLRQWWTDTLAGNTEAFNDIHKALFDGLYYYASKLLNDNGLADDAVQELFVKVWTKRTSIGNLEKVKPYFFTVLRRQILNQLRSLKLRELKIKMSIEPDICFSIEEIIVEKETEESLHTKLTALLNELPARQKEAIYLRYYEDMEYKQIAEIMNVNYQSVLNLIQKALNKLRSEQLLALFLSAMFIYKDLGRFE